MTMPSDKSRPAPWTTGSQVLPTVQLEPVNGNSTDRGRVSWQSSSKVLAAVVLEPVDSTPTNSECPLRFQISMRWLTPEEGGRKTPIRGERYTPTARFAGEQDQFSVILEFADRTVANPTKGTLRLLFPDLIEIQRRVGPGTALEIMEGGRVVAHCLVENLDGAVVVAAR
jgi:hypothetical protein